MPSHSRALTRAARSRAKTEGVRYTAARETELAIRMRMDETGEPYAAAEAIVTDPANKTICDRCGWTAGMACPECAKGCGCNTGCTGWRHHEYADPDPDDVDRDAECPQCGGDLDALPEEPYGCGCD